MKKIYNFLKYIICGCACFIILKTGFDFFRFKKHPDVYAYNSAPWYTGALLWGALLTAVIIICVILRLILRKMMKKQNQPLQKE